MPSFKFLQQPAVFNRESTLLIDDDATIAYLQHIDGHAYDLVSAWIEGCELLAHAIVTNVHVGRQQRTVSAAHEQVRAQHPLWYYLWCYFPVHCVLSFRTCVGFAHSDCCRYLCTLYDEGKSKKLIDYESLLIHCIFPCIRC